MSPNEMINFNCRKSSKYKLYVGDIIEWACQVEQKIQNKVLVGQLCCRILPTWNININGHKILESYHDAILSSRVGVTPR